ncbi:MAG: methionine sulfoxide reductase [Thermodesulfobacteriota bacterium]|nr:MAG: methionine sulfoxide reductase [Thermodesulfobacteriota bacterium]
MTKSTSTIKVFLVNGKPQGLRFAEISNWTGKAIACPRSELTELFKRDEIDNQGIYILYGVDPKTDENAIYIGEAEEVKRRLKQQREKDYWNNVIIFTSKDDNLTKAHVKYLESNLILRANKLSKAKTMNSTLSSTKLPESDEADMNVFLDKMYQLLPILGLNSFTQELDQDDKNTDMLYYTIKGLTARGKRTPNGFMVFENSQTVKNHRPSATSIKRIRERLIKDQILIPNNGHLIFTKDYEFSSPSYAGGVVCGGNTNGLKDWKNKKGIPLGKLELSS